MAITAALGVWLTYGPMAVGVLLAAGLTPKIAVLAAVWLLTKRAAICLGAWVQVLAPEHWIWLAR